MQNAPWLQNMMEKTTSPRELHKRLIQIKILCQLFRADYEMDCLMLLSTIVKHTD